MKPLISALIMALALTGCAKEQPEPVVNDNVEFETSFVNQAVMMRASQGEKITERSFQVTKDQAVDLISYYTPKSDYCMQYVSGINLTTYTGGKKQVASAVINEYCEPFNQTPTLDTISNYVLKPHFKHLKSVERREFTDGLYFEVLHF